MRKLLVWQSGLAGCLLLGLVTSVNASGVSPALKQLVQDFLTQHPAAQAARADLQRAEAEARATGQPLYNPEIEVEYEDAADITKTVGLVQSFDWSGKQPARDRAGHESMRAAQAALAAKRQAMLGELLSELSGVLISSEAARLSQERVKLLGEFLRLSKRRYAAGDVGQTDVDLARLALSEARMQAASTTADAMSTEARLAALVQTPPSGWPALPLLPTELPAFNADKLLQQHPALRQLEAEAAAARASIAIARRDRRPDPTIGVRGGKEDDDTLLGITVSIPLFVRNTFRAELDAANADAVRAEQFYYNRLLRAKGRLQGAAQRYSVTRAALNYWEKSGQPSLKGRIDLLKRLWESGEIGTTEYLIQLQQTLDTQASAIKLQGAVWTAWIDWLIASGRTTHWLGL
ncbi:cobalt-zinc-cadmium efflux system outer membrane protein [Thiogranum longum]|uniref:Cobalt-zinc-cadmium efflux system outer membrane protein n=1 Tax=Thiogranum longum TaxID=1537524 RepID=A0A4V2PGR4_9GAMM|nr:TolC family protein [Thiogranum longum]TCK17866.1 cobalt-zinc-cadmium efflux system outer membrane protein [Thiogranum longum]